MNQQLLIPECQVSGGAQFSKDRIYRYALWRTWDSTECTLVWIGLNPSTADENTNDPTIRRCIGFARDFGYGGIVMLNLFAFRATDPKQMKAARDPVGPKNDEFIRMYVESDLGQVVAAWGVHGSHLDRDQAVAGLPVSGFKAARNVSDFLWCLRRTRDGHPRHPLFVPKATKLIRYRGR